LNFSHINSFKEAGIDIFDINDDFFTDVCLAYSNSGNDMILEDRIKDIFQNYSLCEEGCTYNDIYLENMTISCNCKVKENFSTVIVDIDFDEIEEISSLNFDIAKCYNLVFSLNGKMSNIGFWIFTFLLIAHIPFLIMLFMKGIDPVKEYLFKEMVKYGYLNDIKDNKNLNKKKKGKSMKRKKKQILIQKNSSIHNPPKNNENKTKGNDILKKNHNEKNIKLIDSSSLSNIKSPIKDNIVNQINFNDKDKNKNKNRAKKIRYRKKNIDEESTYQNFDKINSCNIEEKNVINHKIKKNKNHKKIKNKAKKLSFKDNIKNKNTQNMPTQDNTKNKSGEHINIDDKNNNNNDLNFISINLNLSRKKNYFPQNSYITLYNYTMEESFKYDKRQLCVIFYIFLLSKQAIFHAFLYRSPVEVFPLRICLLFFIISSDLALNAFFYFNDNISKKYRYTKSLFLFTFTNNITVILLSTLVGFILLTLFTKLSNSTKAIRDVFKNEEEKLIKDKKYIITDKRKKEIQKEIENILKKYKIKIICLIIIELIFMLFFWYYVVAFCHVFKSTQISWILDSSLSMLSRIIIDALICFGLAKLYRIAVDSEMSCLYKVVIFLYGFD